MELLRLREAAELAGVSYPTLKQWIYCGKIKSVKTAGGHHRIPRAEIERLSGVWAKPVPKSKPVGLNAMSGRNKLFGRIVEVRYKGLLAQIAIDVGLRRRLFCRTGLRFSLSRRLLMRASVRKFFRLIETWEAATPNSGITRSSVNLQETSF